MYLPQDTTLSFQVPAGDEQAQPSSVATQNEAAQVELTVVVPFYNSANTVAPMYERLTACLSKITPDYEIVCIEDCGKDDSWNRLLELAKKDSRVRVFKMSRNFGQHAAITAGLSVGRGRWTAVMDCDLQDPPEYIAKFYEKAQEGYDIVLGKRLERQHSVFRKVAASVYAAMLRFFAQPSFTGQYGSFSLLSRTVVDAYLKFSDRNRHYLLILLWLGFNRTDVDYQQAERVGSKSSYSLSRLIMHALQGVFFQTTVLLQLIVGLGFAASAAGLFIAAWQVYNYFVHSSLEGWTSLVVLILLMGGAILICLGIVGLYIGQIFEQVKERPLFVFARESDVLLQQQAKSEK